MNIPLLVSVAKLNSDVVQRLKNQNVGIELSYFSFPDNLENENLSDKIQEHKDLLKDFPLPITMHGAFYDLSMTAREPRLVELTRFRINQSLDIAIELGVQKIIFHTNYVHSKHSDYKGVWLEKQIAFWKEFIPKVEKHNLILNLENTREEDYTYIGGILDALQHPNFKTCYDTGHSHCFTTTQNKPLAWVEGYGNHLSYIHLHSNNGEIDQHIAFNKGTVDFSGFFEAILALPNPPFLVIEVAKQEDYLISLERLRAMGF